MTYCWLSFANTKYDNNMLTDSEEPVKGKDYTNSLCLISLMYCDDYNI